MSSLRFRLPAFFLAGLVLAGLVASLIAIGLFQDYARDQLLERVWGYTFAGDTRTVDVHVGQLRRKLGEACPIVTVWGVGYKVATEPKPAKASQAS